MKLDEECRRESPSSVATVKHLVRSNVPLFARELLAGGAAGAIAKTCVAPLERTKILLMTGKAQSDALGTLRALVAAEGLAGLFRGNGASCLRIVPYAAIHFSAYEFYRRQLQECLAPTATAQQPAAQQHTGGSPAVLGGTGAAAAQAASPGSRGRGLVRPAAAGARRGGEEGSSELRPSGDDVEQVGSPALTSSIDASTSTHHTGRPPASPAPPGPTPAFEATPTPAAAPVAPAAASARATRLGPGWDLLAGSAAGATAVLLTYPLDIIRTRLAWATEIGAPGSTGPGLAAAAAGGGGSGAGGGGGHRIAAMLVHTYTHEGVAGLYRGLAPTLYGILPYAGLKFYVYASLKNWYKDSISASSSGAAGGASNGSSASGGAGERLPLPVMLAFGGVSGLLAQTVTYPLDVVRRRMQVAGLQQQQQQVLQPGQQQAALARPVAAGDPAVRPAVVVAAPVGATTWGTAVAIARGEGMRGLFRGLSLNYVKVVPSTAIGFAVYDSLKDFLGVKGNL